jgi:hypothetical protein
VHATSDGGQTWKTISPDLTTNDKTMMGDSGGLTVDNLSVEYAGVVYTIAESPREKGVIWAGANDGVVSVTRDGGATWSNVTPGAGLPPKGTVASVDPSPHENGVCYIAVDLHQVNNRDPFLFKTSDYGKTWKSISSNIPKGQLSYAHIVREDPFRRGLLYAGTENALYVSFDDGGRWEPLQGKLPHAPVYWLTVQPTFHDLVIGTYGRGFYILDDVTPLEQFTDSVRSEAVHLFEPRPAWRFRSVSQSALAPVGTSAGQNPPYGATLNYWLKDAVKSPEKKAEDGGAASAEPEKRRKSPVEIVITNSAGEKIRTLRGTGTKGLNRVAWDLRYEPSQPVRLRTTPSGNPHVWDEKRFRGKDSRGIFYYGITAIRNGPLVPPGTYTVKLAVEGKEFTQQLVVKKDPNSAGSESDVEAATKLSMAIYRDTNVTARMINQLEWSRRQVEDFRKMLSAAKAPPADTQAADDLEKQFRAVEDRLLQPTLAENDEKSFRGPLELYLKFLWLQAEVGPGAADVSGNADFPPTQPELEVYDLLSKTLADTRRQFDELYGKTVPAFNDAMKAKGYIQLMTVKEPEETGAETTPEPDEDSDS